MKYKPLISPKKEKETVFFDFSGGINANFSEENLVSNQLRSGSNVYSEFGRLKSRPAFNAETRSNTLVTDSVIVSDHAVVVGEFEITKIKGYKKVVVLLIESTYDSVEVFVSFVADDNTVRTCTRLFFPSISGRRAMSPKNVLILEGESSRGLSGLYVAVPLLYKSYGDNVTPLKKVLFYEFDADNFRFLMVNKAEFHAPLNMINLRGDNWSDAMFDINYPTDITEFLKPNLLGGGKTAAFTADSHSYTFTIPYSSFDDDADILVEWEMHEGVIRKWRILAGETSAEEINPGQYNPISVEINRQTKVVKFKDMYGNNYPLPHNNYFNQVRISVFAQNDEALYDLIESKTNMILYDDTLFFGTVYNGRYGIYAFFKGENKYLPEDNLTYIDNIKSAVTALATQGKYTVAFKRDALYRLNFVLKSEEKTYKFYSNKTVTVYRYDLNFEKINSTIGCDCPKTVCLCNNRLVWLNTDGCVYTLYGSNRYTEGNIYEISSNISTVISEKENLTKAFGGMYKGNYMIFCKDSVFLMNTAVANFKYISGAKRKISADGGLPFYVFNCPEKYEICGAVPVKNGVLTVFKHDFPPVYGTYTAAFFEDAGRDIFYEFISYNGQNYDDIREYTINSDFLTKSVKIPGEPNAVKRIQISVDYKSEKQFFLYITDINGKELFEKQIEESEEEKTAEFCYVGILPGKIRIKGKVSGKFEINSISLKSL